MQDPVFLTPQMLMVSFLEGLVANYWIPSNILSVKAPSTVSLFVKELQLLGAASKKQ